MSALLGRLPAAQPGQQHAARRIDPGHLAALVHACGTADATLPRRRAVAGPGRAADRLRAGGAAAARRGQVRPAHRHDLVAPGTVKKHVTHVLGKLGAANRTEAVARARELGLIPDIPPAGPGNTFG